MLLIVRIIVMFLLLLGTLIFGILPICVKPYLSSCNCTLIHQRRCPSRKQRLATSFLIFFGGGVLLSTCFVHLLHEARQGFEEALEKCKKLNETRSGNETLNLSNSTVLSTLKGIETLNREQVLLFTTTELDYTDINDEMSLTSVDDETSPYPTEVRTSSQGTYNFKTKKVEEHANPRKKRKRAKLKSVLEKEAVFDKILCSGEMLNSLFPLPEFVTVCGFFLIYFVEELIKLAISLSRTFKRNSHDLNTEMNSFSSKSINKGTIKPLEDPDNGTPRLKHEKCPSQKGLQEQSVKQSPNSECDRKKSINDLRFFYGHIKTKDINCEGLEDFMTVLALSFHSIFEGFAAGFQHTEKSTWMLFVALALHKFVSAFVVGLETLHSGGSNLRVALFILMFSLMTPLGMITAICAHHTLTDSFSLMVSMLNAISVGTLLYVTFFEMLRQKKDFAEISGFGQFGALLLGFCVMSIIEYIYTRAE